MERREGSKEKEEKKQKLVKGEQIGRWVEKGKGYLGERIKKNEDRLR